MPALGASNKHRIQANLCVHAKAGRIVAYSDITPPLASSVRIGGDSLTTKFRFACFVVSSGTRLSTHIPQFVTFTVTTLESNSSFFSIRLSWME